MFEFLLLKFNNLLTSAKVAIVSPTETRNRQPQASSPKDVHNAMQSENPNSPRAQDYVTDPPTATSPPHKLPPRHEIVEESTTCTTTTTTVGRNHEVPSIEVTDSKPLIETSSTRIPKSPNNDVPKSILRNNSPTQLQDNKGPNDTKNRKVRWTDDFSTPKGLPSADSSNEMLEISPLSTVNNAEVEQPDDNNNDGNDDDDNGTDNDDDDQSSDFSDGMKDFFSGFANEEEEEEVIKQKSVYYTHLISS